MNEWGDVPLQGHGIAIEGDGIYVDLNPIRL